MRNGPRCARWGGRVGVRSVWAAVAAVVLVTMHGAAGCRPATTPLRRTSSELRVGVTPNYPPLVFKEDGQIRGVEADFARQLSIDLGVQVVFVELAWDDLIPALTAGRIDVIMSGMSVTEQRSKTVSFTQPYLRVGQMALVRRSEYTRLRDPGAMDLATSRVGFQAGTTGEEFVRASLTHATLKGFAAPADGIAALRAGEIDFFVHDAPTIWRTTGGLERSDPQIKGIYRPLTEEYLAWAVRKGDERRREELNTALLRWQHSGRVQSILDHWITVRKVTVELEPAAAP